MRMDLIKTHVSNGNLTSSPNQSPVLLRGATTGTNQQPKQDGRDLSHLKSTSPIISPQDSPKNNLKHSVERTQPNPNDWSRDQVAAADRMWLAMSSAPSVSSQVSGAQIKSEEPSFGQMMANEVRTNSHPATFKENLAVLQRPKQNLPPSTIDMHGREPI
ncbi:hypothetical protein HPP92_006694 [Vanilla planifolia]|uniref:Uncharacterized protein n=1 Tax=Vanilla planifolia TaxID=51239 RepID=A0A835V7Y7_VANPL|nr:hypothetical protein HPP92_006694 [Vanilla planifolia]